MKSYSQFITEGSLSRILKHMQNHDSGGITAWRTARDCGKGKPYTRKENNDRLFKLKTELIALGYGVIFTRGEYPEGGGSISGENSFFVFDKDDKGTLKKDLIKLGQNNQQDSILFVPKGGTHGVLYPTNKCDNNWLKKPLNIGKRFMGKIGKEGSSKIGGRPWAFGEIGEEVLPPGNGYGWLALNKINNMSIEEFEEWKKDDA